MGGLACGLDSKNLDDDLARLGPIQLDEKYPLPAPEVHPSPQNRHALAGAQRQVLAVRVGVGALVLFHVDGADVEVIVAIVSVYGRDLREEARHVFKELRLAFVDFDGGCGVARKHHHNAIADTRTIDRVCDIGGDVDELGSLLGLILERFTMGLKGGNALEHVVIDHEELTGDLPLVEGSRLPHGKAIVE